MDTDIYQPLLMIFQPELKQVKEGLNFDLQLSFLGPWLLYEIPLLFFANMENQWKLSIATLKPTAQNRAGNQ